MVGITLSFACGFSSVPLDDSSEACRVCDPITRALASASPRGKTWRHRPQQMPPRFSQICCLLGRLFASEQEEATQQLSTVSVYFEQLFLGRSFHFVAVPYFFWYCYGLRKPHIVPI